MTTDNETNKSAIIAGMAPGFGEALVRALAEKGFSVAGLSRTKTVDLSDLDGSYTHFECDLTDPARVEETIEAVSQEHGAPTVLIYNAMQLIPKPFLELTPEDF
jgi:NAD(P)-dependent dehydrogenase (short-subunit alcohol dehydrogenase family)